MNIINKIKNSVVLLLIALPAFAMIVYQDYQNRLLEPNPEVYGSEYATVKSNRLSKILPDQHEILAVNAYAEARGEGYEGMVAVTNVVRNRVNDPEFPNDYYSVITQPKQFSWLNSGNSIVIDDEHSWELAQQIASLELKNKLPDLVNGARFYANPRKVDVKRHKWVVKYQPLAEIGNHVYMDKPEVVKAKGLKPVNKNQLSKPVQKILAGNTDVKTKPSTTTKPIQSTTKTASTTTKPTEKTKSTTKYASN